MSVEERQAGPGPAGTGRPATEPAAGRAARRRRPRLPVWWPWLVAPVLVLLCYAALPAPTDVRARFETAALALITAPVLAWLLTRRGPLAHHAAGAWMACLLPAWTLTALHGTDYFFAGPTGDQSFRLEYATRFAASLGHLTDYTYNVPAFYSPGWFWVVGATSAATGAPAWQVYKWAAIATLYLAGVVAFFLWRASCGTRLSALLLTATSIGLPAAALPWLGHTTLLTAGAYEPYSWVVALALPAVLTWYGMATDGFSWRRGVVLGAALGLAAWLYLLYAAVAILCVLVLGCRRDRWRARWLEIGVAGVVCLVVVLPWLGPFMRAWAAAGFPVPSTTTWLEDDSYLRLVIPVASPWLALAGVGAVGLLVFRSSQHRRLMGCQAVAATVLALGLVQAVAAHVGRGDQFPRLALILGMGLLAAGMLTFAEIRPALRRLVLGWFPGFPVRRFAAAVLGVASVVTLTAHADEWFTQPQLRKVAMDSAYPDGTVSPLASPDARSALVGQPSVDDLAAALRSVIREAGRPASTPVLTDDIPLLSLTDSFGYLQWWQLYAHPLGRYPERRAYLDRLASLPAADTVARLRADADAPTVFVLQSQGDRPTYTSMAWDPRTGASPTWTVRLAAGLLDDPAFATRHVGSWTVAALRKPGG